MQLLVVSVLLVLFVAQGEAIKSIPVTALSDNEANCGKSTSFISCQNCTHAAICFRGQIYDNFACGALNPNTPFCSTGPDGDECTSEMRDLCVSPETPAATKCACTGLGFFPDPHDCTKYHHCKVEGAPSMLHSCPTNYVYNMQKQECEESELSEQCVVVNCEKMRSPLNVFKTAERQYYAFCKPIIENGLVRKKPIVFRCANSAIFEQNEQRCVYQCTRLGRFPNSERPNMYYQCAYQGSKLVGTLVSCPVGQQFNAATSNCV